MTLGRRWWMVCTAGLILTYAVVSLNWPKGFALTALGNLTSLLVMVLSTVVMAANALSNRGQTRVFWSLMAAGCLLWTVNQGMWTVYEVLLRREIPDPFAGDVILFIHVVPLMAAMALRPHRPQEEQKIHFSTLNFLMLLIWWVFLYGFVVFPEQYVVLNASVYSRNYDLLYLLENLVLLGVLGMLAASTCGAWKKIYWNLFIASVMYTLSSQSMNAAIARGQYYSGSIYDIPFIASLCWLIWAGLLARDLKPTYEPSGTQDSPWLAMAPRLAMLAILSLPAMGYWAIFLDTAPARLRLFRLLVTLSAMLVLGCFVFIRQYLLDRELVRLLDESRRSFENLQRLQTQLVQREKLASLGQLVAGAAHEINNPLSAILGYSELLAGNPKLEAKQVTMAQKIGQQARRTRELVSGLLSFAQQAPAEKSLVDIGSLLHRAVQMEVLQMETKKIRVESRIEPGLHRIWGNTNQLFQCCLEVIGNAMDALEAVGGGTFSVTARREGDEAVLEFADSGPGMREPQRVFDPFYTTKPIGKGTGLGLSATYGVVQDHHGQIACHNRPEGGAVFVIRFPMARESAAVVAEAVKV
jgi:signal transduction histidine kinase